MFVQLWNSFPEELTTKQKIIYTNVTERPFHEERKLYKIINITISESTESVYYPAGNYMFKVNNRNTRTRCEIVQS